MAVFAFLADLLTSAVLQKLVDEDKVTVVKLLAGFLSVVAAETGKQLI